MIHKLLKILLCLIFLTHQYSYSQSYQKKIKFADSLFRSNNFDQALIAYETIFRESGKYSLSMLLKMAFLNEYNGDFSKALFYLNIFYRDQPEKKVLSKMEDLAEKHNLSGYRYTDLEYFISLYNEYYYFIIVYIVSASFAFFGYLILRRMQKKELGMRPFTFLFILMGVYYITNYPIIPPRAIIASKNCYLMSAPSAASEVVHVSSEGHRVTLHGKEDIWYEIAWENGRAFIREDDLHILPEEEKKLF
jgi:hypothetical protein